MYIKVTKIYLLESGLIGKFLRGFGMRNYMQTSVERLDIRADNS